MLNRIRYIILTFGIIFITADIAFAVQNARPSGTVSAGSWTPAATLHEQIDEITPNNDTDYVETTAVSTMEVNLSSVSDPVIHDNHTIRLTLYSNKNSAQCQVQLYQGDSTLIYQTAVFNATRSAWVTEVFTLDPDTQAANISNYADLRLRISCTNTGNGYVYVTQAELEVPDVGAATAPTVTSQPATIIDTASARLWATITDDGGDTITERGTVWDTTSTPRANLLDEGGTATGSSFPHDRSGLPVGTLVYFAGYAINGIGTGYSGDSLFYTEPAQASNIVFSNVTDTGITITWTAGTSDDGGETVGAVVVAKQATAVTLAPADGDDTYSGGTSAYNDGDNLGGDEYVVYAGTGTSVSIDGLTPETTYHVAVYAFVGSGTSTNYQQDGVPTSTGSQATTAATSAPTLINPSAGNIDTTSALLGATITDNGGEAIAARGTVWNTTGAPITENLLAEGGSDFNPYSHSRTGLYEGTLIYYRGYASNSTTGFSPDDSFYTEPGQASTVGFENISDTAMRITWGAGTSDATYGATVNSIVVVKLGSVVTQAPADGTQPTANSVFGTPGTDLGGSEYVVFNGTGTQVDITGLTELTTYHVAVYAFVGSGGSTNYQDTLAPTNSQQTSAAAVLATLSTPTATSIEATSAFLGATITADGGGAISERGTVWGTTSAPTTNAALEGGIDVDDPYSHNRTGLSEGTLVYYRGYADNSAGRAYSTDGSFYTEPGQASGVGFPAYDDTSMTITWSAGSGGATLGYVVVVRQGSAPGSQPSDGSTYSSGSSAYDNGDDLGSSEYVVYAGTGTSVSIDGLTLANTYYVAVYASAGSAGEINYQQTSPATASQATTGGSVAPTLSTPTFALVTDTDATLGATIDTNGGDAITARGTVWNTTGTPDIVTDSARAVEEGGITVGVPYSHSRTLTSGTHIFFRGYATNTSALTGYSSDSSFYTEPTQAASVVISNASHNGMLISWTAGGGDGAIVLVKEGSAVDASPTDGTLHAADTVFGSGGSGAQLGTGNYVVFRSAGTQVSVSGLTESTTYHVAVFEYTGTGSGTSGINYQQDSPPTGSQLTDIPPSGHNADHVAPLGHSCSYCHSAHNAVTGWGGFVPRDTGQEALCTSCHNETGDASAKSDVALHTADSGATIIDCGSCHEVHDGQSSIGTNLSYIRENTSKYETSWSVEFAALEPALLQIRPDHFAFDETTYPSGPYNGICQTCHTRVTKHTNDGYDDTTGDNAAVADNDHEKGSDCIGCHAHESNFAGAGGGCTTCHDKIQDEDDQDAIPARRAIVGASGDFIKASHHVVGGTPTDEDCAVCHMESEVDHKNGLIDLRNPDTGGAIPGFVQFTRANDNDFSDEPWITNVQNLHCMKCHDLLGATGTDVPVEGGTALQPFSSNSRDVPNVFDQFNPANVDHHPVRGAGNNEYCVNTTTNGNITTMELPWNQGATHDVISCFDCHETNGHGSDNQRMIIDQIDFDGMLGNKDNTAVSIPDTISQAVSNFCVRCHKYSIYVSGNLGSIFEFHGANQSQHGNLAEGGSNRMGCMSCHAGTANVTSNTYDNGAARGSIHGRTFVQSASSDIGPSETTRSFIMGGYMVGFKLEGSFDNKGGYWKPACGGGQCNHATGTKLWTPVAD